MYIQINVLFSLSLGREKMGLEQSESHADLSSHYPADCVKLEVFKIVTITNAHYKPIETMGLSM